MKAPLLQAVLTGLLALSLTGCAQWVTEGRLEEAPAPESAPGCGAALSPTDNTKLAAIERLVDEGKPYAALAQLDALGATAPGARLVRADALRRIERGPQARELYEGLLATCLSGRAHHGLGLIAARSGQREASLTHLQKAREALPTDARVRNDLGYALLLTGQWEAAQFEFLTALDLAPQDPLASRNLVLLQLKQNRTEQARELATRLGIDDATFAKLQRQAQTDEPTLPLPAPAASAIDGTPRSGT
ncbi:MAG: hypothetical protein QM742_10915 [Aquabacterium sp.]